MIDVRKKLVLMENETQCLINESRRGKILFLMFSSVVALQPLAKNNWAFERVAQMRQEMIKL